MTDAPAPALSCALLATAPRGGGWGVWNAPVSRPVTMGDQARAARLAADARCPRFDIAEIYTPAPAVAGRAGAPRPGTQYQFLDMKRKRERGRGDTASRGRGRVLCVPHLPKRPLAFFTNNSSREQGR